ncbi:MAG TPA: hypothetical protein VK574_19960 [Terracidiphilus sp.]|nr:hypothetical protein [Terracidiphilus sp.]
MLNSQFADFDVVGSMAKLEGVLKAQLYQVSAMDPIAFIAAGLVVSAMRVLAGWIPARRATRVDPLTALRCE